MKERILEWLSIRLGYLRLMKTFLKSVYIFQNNFGIVIFSFFFTNSHLTFWHPLNKSTANIIKPGKYERS
jgi:hypothetical protein